MQISNILWQGKKRQLKARIDRTSIPASCPDKTVHAEQIDNVYVFQFNQV